jgi:hypothetical protein
MVWRGQVGGASQADKGRQRPGSSVIEGRDKGFDPTTLLHTFPLPFLTGKRPVDSHNCDCEQTAAIHREWKELRSLKNPENHINPH